MKLLLVTFLVLNLAVGRWAVPIEDPVVEETALSPKQLLDIEANTEETTDSTLTPTYQPTNPTEHPPNVCNETYTAASGIISTPNFPNDYTNNMNCYWLIITGTGTRIQLSFDTFVVQNGNDVLAV